MVRHFTVNERDPGSSPGGGAKVLSRINVNEVC